MTAKTFQACLGDKFANVADVYIDSVCYEYRPRYGDAEAFVSTANAIAAHSVGKAILWIKEHGHYLGRVPVPD